MNNNMYENFSRLEDRVLNSLEKTDLLKIKNMLSNINEPTLVSGVGGSSVVSVFLAKVLNIKNNIICESVTSRDLLYKNIACYKNIISCSYSGNNLGVEVSFANELNKYLLSGSSRDGVINLQYIVTEPEKSFISLSSTLVPMAILLSYYLDNDLTLIKDILKQLYSFNFVDLDNYEVLSGYDTNASSKFIETTFIEAGLGNLIVHDKYDYCHGRSTLSYNYDSNLIFFNTGSELDKLLKEELVVYYKDIITFDKKYDDDVVNDFYFTYLSMLLCKKIAECKEKDLSIVKYSPVVKKLYRFKGNM